MHKETAVAQARPHFLPPVWSGSLYYWFFWAFFAIYIPFLNNYFHELGLSGVQIGILVSLAPLMSLVAAPLLSAWADRNDRRKFLLFVAMLCWGIVLLLLRLPTAFLGFFVLMTIEAFVRSPAIPVGDGLVSRMVERHHLDYGRVRLWGSLSFALTSIAMGALWDRVGFAPMFLVAAIAILPILFLTGQLEEETAVAPQTAQSPAANISKPRLQLRVMLRDRGLLTLIVVAFLVGAALIITFMFSGIYMVMLGGNQTYVGMLFGFSAIAEVPVMQRQSSITRRFGAPQTLLLSIVLITAAIGGHAVAWSPNILLLAAILRGLGYGLFTVGLIQLTNMRTPPAWSATALALVNASMVGLAPLMTSTLSGFIFDAWGPRNMFLVVMSWGILGALVMFLGIKKGWFEPRQTTDIR